MSFSSSFYYPTGSCPLLWLSWELLFLIESLRRALRALLIMLDFLWELWELVRFYNSKSFSEFSRCESLFLSYSSPELPESATSSMGSFRTICYFVSSAPMPPECLPESFPVDELELAPADPWYEFQDLGLPWLPACYPTTCWCVGGILLWSI